MRISLSTSLVFFGVLGGIQAQLSAQGVDWLSQTSGGQAGNAASTDPALSGDGQMVVFQSDATNLVANDTNGVADIFFLDRSTGIPVRVSLDTAGIQADGSSIRPEISSNGQFIVFRSDATNLVANDTNALTDIFVHDRIHGITTRVSVDSNGVESNGASTTCDISGDGRYVVFQSAGSNLVAADTNGEDDIFLHDRQTGTTTRVSVDSLGVEGDSFSKEAVISTDGSTIAFTSRASNLVANDTNTQIDAFVHERVTGQTMRVSLKSGGAQAFGNSEHPGLSADGSVVVFTSDSLSIVPGGRNGVEDVYTHDRNTAITKRVSVNSQGVAGVFWSWKGTISDDGRYVAFESYATDLVTRDTNLMADVFLHDRTLEMTTNLSFSRSATQGNRGSANPSISSDGSIVIFDDFSANLDAGDTNGVTDIFINDRNTYPNLRKYGTCPGPMKLAVTNLTPGGTIVYLYGDRGTYTHVGAHCNGLTLGIANPLIGGMRTADAAGEWSMSFVSQTGVHCWQSVQVVDIATCVASNLLTL
ncbi:MAG: TolB family protein [Planctomycetota bacterium]